MPRTKVIVVSTALTAEGCDTAVFGRGEIFHTIFISSWRTRNIGMEKRFRALTFRGKRLRFVENAYVYSFHQFCIPFYLVVGLKAD